MSFFFVLHNWNLQLVVLYIYNFLIDLLTPHCFLFFIPHFSTCSSLSNTITYLLVFSFRLYTHTFNYDDRNWLLINIFCLFQSICQPLSTDFFLFSFFDSDRKQITAVSTFTFHSSCSFVFTPFVYRQHNTLSLMYRSTFRSSP